MLDTLLDVFRLRQYFDAAARWREVAEGTVHDLGFLADLRRPLVALPTDRWPRGEVHPFGPPEPLGSAWADGRRVALISTGGSGALASVVGVARAAEECGVDLSVISCCSGSALFAFPIAAGLPAEEVAAFTCGLRPSDYVDPDWPRLLSLVPTLARGFAGIIRGDRLEATYRRLLGDPLQQVQRLLGHSSLTTTYIYLDHLAGCQDTVDTAVEELLSGIETPPTMKVAA